MKKIFLMALVVGFFLSYISWAADLDCQVCGMKIGEKAPNHFVLKKEKGNDSLHVCSIPCVIKGRKNASGFTKIEVSDFNHPGKLLDGNKAFFLIKSKNIKKDLGEMVMPPYVVAFATKEEALAAQKRQGDGTVVQGFENAL